jgi:ABC-type nitrate/sulfonate/bicarbonate transport system permease component
MTATSAMKTATPAGKRLESRRFLSAGRLVVMYLGVPLALIGVWWAVSEQSDSFYFPPLSKIAEVFGPTWFEGRFGTDVMPSILRLFAGYALALIVGVGAGIAIGLSRTLRAFTEPTLEFFRAIPPPVLIPIVMLFLGIFTPMKIFVIAAGAVWPILLNTIEGVRGMDDVLRDTSRVYRLRPRSVLTTLVLRGASPAIAAGARQALSVALILMVISEMFAASNGIGFTLVQFQRGFMMPEMWAGIILLGLIGVVLSLIFQIIERTVLAWYHGQRQSQRGAS